MAERRSTLLVIAMMVAIRRTEDISHKDRPIVLDLPMEDIQGVVVDIRQTEEASRTNPGKARGPIKSFPGHSNSSSNPLVGFPFSQRCSLFS